MLILCLLDLFIYCLHLIIFMINSIEDDVFPLFFKRLGMPHPAKWLSGSIIT